MRVQATTKRATRAHRATVARARDTPRIARSPQLIRSRRHQPVLTQQPHVPNLNSLGPLIHNKILVRDRKYSESYRDLDL